MPNIIPNHINGQSQIPHASNTLDVISPVDGSVLGRLAPTPPSDLDLAVSTAQAAFASWSTTPVKERVQVLFNFKHLVEQHLVELGELISRENGKLPAEGRAGVEKGLEVVEYATSLPQLITGEILEVSSGVDCYTRRFPLGVVAGITPFNFPAMVPMWMFPLAIACGNTFILKPSEQVPLTPLRLAELLQEAGLPDGVFNVVQGDRTTVEAILDHPGIAAAAFVGSTPVARLVYERGTRAGKRMLTLGGAKNHLVVVPDADVEVTAKNVVSSFTGCAGQRCMAASVLIAVGDCQHILDAIVAQAQKIRPGQDMGAIISAKARDRIISYIDLAEKEGATLRTDGRGVRVPGKENGFYVGPTVIEHPDRSSKCLQDEIFGPVISILRVKTLDEALAIENANPYGNAASIYTTSGAVARYFEQRASAGMIGINIGVPVPREPFAFGGWNDSKFGTGDITGKDGIAFWTKPKKVTVKWTAGASRNWMS
ncbi:MAG: CoA-acylating methylmalonate-semialdehyde dehydrogenase [Candidatus Methylacidiphilales bacterium]